MPPKPKRSRAIYQHFDETPNKLEKRCRRCLQVVKTCGNTSNLHHHLKRKHPRTFELLHAESDRSEEEQQAQQQQPQQEDIDPDNPDDVVEVNPEQEAAQSSSGRSPLSISGHKSSSSAPATSVASTSKSSQGPVTSKLPTKTLLQPLLTESVKYQRALQGGGDRERAINDAFLFMITKDHMPFRTVEKEGFRHFAKVALPLWKVPDRKKVVRQLESKYLALSVDVKSKLKTADSVCLTTDIWKDTSNSRSYLGITAHYIVDDHLESTILSVTYLKDRHTGENLKAHIEETLKQWEIQLIQLTAIVTDGADNICNAAKGIVKSDYRHLWCCAHRLNLVVTAALECDEVLIVAIKKIESLIEFFRSSGPAADALKAAQGEKFLKLIKYSPTRWNSKFKMIKRFLELNDVVTRVALQFPGSPSLLTACEIQVLRDAVNCLRPMEEATENLCGEKFVSASLVIPLINCLKKDLTKLIPVTDTGKLLKLTLIDEMERADRFGLVENHVALMIAMTLDPRFKRIHAENAIAFSRACTKINEEIKCLEAIRKNAKKTTDKEEPQKEEEVTGIWRHHIELKKAHGQSQEGAMIGGLHQELKLYLSEPLSDSSTRPIQFWNLRKEVFPSLSKIALKYLTITATSVPSERLFSTCGDILTDDRNRLDPYKLPQLCFLHSMTVIQWVS